MSEKIVKLFEIFLPFIYNNLVQIKVACIQCQLFDVFHKENMC